MIGFNIIGMAGALNAVRDFVSDDKLEALVKRAALEVEAEAKRIVPVDTGRLKNSLSSEQIDKLSYRVGSGVVYAPFVEFGTRNMRSQPFLRPAADKVRARLPMMRFSLGGL